MNPEVRHLPFRTLGTSEVHLRYLEQDRDLATCLGLFARDASQLLERAPIEAQRLVPAEDLSKALVAYAERHDAAEASQQNARDVADGNTRFVITGQQPGLLGGPLYTVHKAATAVRLARELNAERPDGPKIVPLFWNHSDDHDFDEVAGTYLPNGNQDLQRFRLDVPHNGESIRKLATGKKLREILAAVGDFLPDTEFREEVFALFEPRHPDEPLGDAVARLLFWLFKDDGILVIEPRDLPAKAFEVLPKWWERAEEIRARVAQAAEHLGDIGLDVTMDPGATLMFQLVGDRRMPMSEGDPIGPAQDLSPGALLRPLWQDACLPTIAFVVGPGELSYLAIAGPLYRQLGVPMPVLVPRASITLVEGSLAKLLDRFDWDIPKLSSGIEELAAEVLDEAQGGVDEEIDQLAEMLGTRMREITARLKKEDQQLVGGAERSRSRTVEELTKLADKVRKTRASRQGTGLRQIRRLCNNLRPRGRLQERVLPPFPALVMHGEALGGALIEAADPFATDHAILHL